MHIYIWVVPSGVGNDLEELKYARNLCNVLFWGCNNQRCRIYNCGAKKLMSILQQPTPSNPNPTQGGRNLFPPWSAVLFSSLGAHETQQTTVYLEPKWPPFLQVNPQKQGIFQSKQGSFRFQVYRFLRLQSLVNCLCGSEAGSERPGIQTNTSTARCWGTTPFKTVLHSNTQQPEYRSSYC